MGYKAISDYGLIGNTHSAALVGLDGSIDWCCFPRFDSPSVFAAILDQARGGRFKIAPLADYRSHQSYQGYTNILVTEFHTAAGRTSLADFMPCYQLASGALQTYYEIHRVLRCHNGEMTFDLDYEPRFDYARSGCELLPYQGGVVATSGGEYLLLATPVALVTNGDKASATFTLRRGQEVRFVLRYGDNRVRPMYTYRSRDKQKKTHDYWLRQSGP